MISTSMASREQRHQANQQIVIIYQKSLQLKSLESLREQVEELKRDKVKTMARIQENQQKLVDRERALTLQWEFSKIDLN